MSLSGSTESAVILDEVALCARMSGLDIDRVRELARYSIEQGRSLARQLIDRADVDEPTLLEGLARELRLPYTSTVPTSILPEVLSRIPATVAVRYNVLPLGDAQGRLQVACSDPFDWKAWDEFEHILGSPADKVLCPAAAIEKALREGYGLGAETVERLVAERETTPLELIGPAATDIDDKDAANEPTVVSLVNKIIVEGIRAAASDIHCEPLEERFRVRYRIDGILEDVAVPGNVQLLRQAVVSRIKIMFRLDITEKRLPQDGRSQVSLGGHTYDLRVSILPGLHGEAVVMRVQSRQTIRLSLESLGFRQDEQVRIECLLEKPHGLVLVTGPTGSGKTTTLYTCLGRVNRPETKIITIEDPIEYWMDGVLQMQVHELIGYTFARALRGMLRHDPDVMLVGEIRDRETADIAIRSALTGHLVFSTLHTNDAASGVTRLLDIGIEPFLLASSINGIIAQRLVRKVCKSCKHCVASSEQSEAERRIATEFRKEAPIVRGARCGACRFSGYSGRTAIAEVLTSSPSIRELIQSRAPAEELKRLSRQEGMRTLRESGIEAIREGRTDCGELLRVAQEDD